MPTGDRPRFARQAIRYFLRQTFHNAELIIVDDGAEPLSVPDDPRIRHIRLDHKLTVGEKRNIACEAARGEFIVHWDDDDWYPADRLAIQVAAMDGVDVCGVDRMLYLDVREERGWRFVHEGGGWLSALCYRRSFWARNRFPHVQRGSDTLFLRAGDASRYRTLGETLQVCTLHGGNVSPKDTRGWADAGVAEVRAVLGADWPWYQALFGPTRWVGILTSPQREKGLWRDAECLRWAIGGQALVSIRAPQRLTDVRRGLDVALFDDLGCPAGTVESWLARVDVLMVCEVLVPELFDAATARGVRVVYIPNLDWAQLDGHVRDWVAALAARPAVEVCAKTPQAAERLRSEGLQVQSVPWSVPDEVVAEPRVRDAGPPRFLMNAGTGGWRGRRGVDLALEAFARARASAEMTLALKLVRPLAEVHEGPVPDGVRVISETVDRAALDAMYREADAVLHPSRWEGFGLPMLEALHRGLPVIATDGWPMNELVVHERNGLLVRARRVGDMRLAPHWEADVDALAEAMVRFATDAELRDRLACPTPGEWLRRQDAFREAVGRRLAEADPTPSGAEASSGLRLNLGCGHDVRAGYVNVDQRSIPGVDVVADLARPLPFPDACAEEVLAFDILEHFPRSVLRDQLLPEIRRVLRVGGRLVARLPDLETIVAQWRRGECDAETAVLRIHGRQDYDGNLHYWSYTGETFGALLASAGFGGVRRTRTIRWNMELEAFAGARPSAPLWDARAQARGELGVVPASWDAARYRQETQRWWQLAYSVLRRTCARGRVLDFGCGAGRFAELMARSGYRVDGVDRSATMLELARARACAVDWHLLSGPQLPFPADTFDAVWTCTVLQHVPENELEAVIAELRRVLRPRGTWVSFENTHQQAGRTSRSGHVVFREPREYQAHLCGAAVVRHLHVDGERHTLFAGTCR